MTGHDPRHERWLEAVLCGEPEADALRRALEACPRCAEELRELELAAGLLDAAAGGAALEAELEAPFPAGEQAARRRLLDLAAAERGGQLGRAPARRWRLGLGLLVAAGLLAVAGLRLFAPAPPAAPLTPLRDGALQRIAPAGRVVPAAGLELVWSGERGDHEEYVVRVEDEAGRALLDAPVRLTEPRWTPPPAEVARWPELVVVVISVEGPFEPPAPGLRFELELRR